MRILPFMFTFVILISSIPAWVTHVIVSIQAQEWLFMIVGALIPFIAVIHGWAYWLGFTWF